MKDVLDGIGPRVRRIRRSRGMTLREVARSTGISVSTLSRLESGARRPTVALLLPLSQTFGVPLDALGGAPPVGDPRVHPRPVQRHGMTGIPLVHVPGPHQAVKMVIPAARNTPTLCRHEGLEWMYVLSGRLRLIVGDHDQILRPGQAADFDTRAAHWFGSTGAGPVELLSLLGLQGQRIHLAGPEVDDVTE